MDNTTIDQGNWQESKSTVKERISHLYKNKSMSDFAFVSGGVRFPVHKLILASASSVFQSMFYGSIPEKNGELDLSEYGNEECISEFLKFIYTDEISLKWEVVFKILNLAECYMISSLKEKCTNFIQSEMTQENVLTALEQGLLFENKAVVEKSFEVIWQNTSYVLKHDSFMTLNLRTVKEIMKQDKLNIEEIDLFLAVDKWCENQLTKEGKEVSLASKRETLGDAVYLFRFAAMSWSDFGKNCIKSQLLTPVEICNLVHYLSLDSDGRQQAASSIGAFSKQSIRTLITNEQVIQAYFQSYAYSSYGYSSQNYVQNTLEFHIKKKAWLKGVLVIRTNISDIRINKIKENIAIKEGSLRPLGLFYGMDFRAPVEIFPDSLCMISASVSGNLLVNCSLSPNSGILGENLQCKFHNFSDNSCAYNPGDIGLAGLIFDVQD